LDPYNTRLILSRAVAINPRLSPAWIELGLTAERAGDLLGAENALLQAVRADHQYQPAWTLANYYFRRGNSEAFWSWARRAAELTYDDFRPLLRLCDAVERDPEMVLSRLEAGRPAANAAIIRAYLDFLIGQDRFDAAQQAARRLLAIESPGDSPRVAALAGRQIRAGNQTAALELWNARFAPLDPLHGSVLTNGDFSQPTTGVGFDWSQPACEGVTTAWSPARLAFEFSGSQPDACVILEQAIPVRRGIRYHFRFEYVTAQSFSGVRWAFNRQEIVINTARREGDDVFLADRAGPARLMLLYRREPGSTPARGRIELRHIRLEVSPPAL
jgi:tetratricopeptide (TPR) repeat protein